MGQTTSSTLEEFINNNLNTSIISDVISSYASQTNAITTNTQNLEIDLSGCTISGDLQLNMEIENYIDVSQMIDRTQKDVLVNDLQRAVSNTLKGDIQRWTDGLDILARPEVQELRERILNSVDTYVRQTINTNTVDNLLLSSANVQNGKVYAPACSIGGSAIFNQRIQSNMMASNIIKSVVDRMISNRDVLNLYNLAQGQVKTESVSPITSVIREASGIINKNISSWLFYVLGAIIFIGGIIAAIALGYFTGKIWLSVIVGAIAIALAIGIILMGIVVSRLQ